MTEKLNNHRKRHESFWNLNPCDGHSNSIQERQHLDLPRNLVTSDTKSIAKYNSRLLEIGCAQGTDAYTVIEKRLSVSKIFIILELIYHQKAYFKLKKIFITKSEEKQSSS